MNPELKAKWLAALRSATYGQCQGALRRQPQGFCCLGVLLDVSGAGDWKSVGVRGSGYEGDEEKYVLREPFQREDDDGSVVDVTEVEGELSTYRRALGLSGYHEGKLIEMNDQLKWNFNQIADWIEGNVK